MAGRIRTSELCPHILIPRSDTRDRSSVIAMWAVKSKAFHKRMGNMDSFNIRKSPSSVIGNGASREPGGEGVLHL